MAEVVAICWPEERDDAARFVMAGVAVLYIVRADDDPPIPTGCLEDCVRIPGDDRDLHARITALELRVPQVVPPSSTASVNVRLVHTPWLTPGVLGHRVSALVPR
jgi:hypothetical protein